MLLGGLLLPGCTSVGQWLYDDPSFALRGVTPHPQAGADSLELSLVGCNLNDYDLTGDTFAARLLLGGHLVGQGERDRPIHLSVRDSIRFSVMLGVDSLALRPTGDLPFAIAAKTALRTPIGVRQVAFRLSGKVRQASDGWEWKEEGYGLCRPGLVAIPPQFSQPVVNDAPGSTKARPTTGVNDTP
jgi:hypothetical protein